MAKLTLREMETIQRALGIIEGVSCGVPEMYSTMLTTAVEMIDCALRGSDDG